MFELFNFPEKLSLDYLGKLAITMFDFCRHYIALPRPDRTNFSIFINCIFQRLSFHLMDKARPVDRIKAHLQAFCEAALEGRLDPYSHGGIANELIADAAKHADFKYLNGNGLRAAVT